MFNTRGGGGAAPGMRGGGEGVTSPVGDASAAASAPVPQGSGATVPPVLDLIQPHSVSAEEVAGFYGCTMGQVRKEGGKEEATPRGSKKRKLKQNWPFFLMVIVLVPGLLLTKDAAVVKVSFQ